MVRQKNNMISDLVELTVRLSKAYADNNESSFYSVQSSLRASFAEMYCFKQKVAFVAKIKKLNIRLILEGLEIGPGIRRHDNIKLPDSSTKSIDKKVVKTEAELGINSGSKASTPSTGSAHVELIGQARKTWSKSNEIETVKESIARHVTAKPGDRWEIQDAHQNFLDGTYLTESDPLCGAELSKGANRVSVSAYVEVMQRDLELDIKDESALKRLTTNKERLMGIFIAKSIVTSYSASYSGKIILCHAEDNGDE